MKKGYVTENFTANISVDEYISRFRDEKRFVEFCKQCPNYGNSWGCPPFDFDTGEFLRQYKYAYLIATKIVPIEKGIPIDKSQELIRPERISHEINSVRDNYSDRQNAGIDYTGSAQERKGIAGNGAQIRRSGIRLCRKMPILSRFRMRPQMQPSLPASGQSTSLA